MSTSTFPSSPVGTGRVVPTPGPTQYDGVADAYDRLIRPKYDAIAAHVARAVESAADVSRSVVLELSAGTGALTHLLAPRGESGYIATDVSAPMLAVARRRVSRAGRVAWLRAAVEEVPLPSHLADVVVSSLGPVQDTDQALAEARRMLAPGGRFVACTWGDDYAELDLLQEARRRLGVEPRTVLRATDLDARVCDAGFHDVSVSSFRLPVVHDSLSAYRAYRSAFGPVPVPDGLTSEQLRDAMIDATSAYLDSEGRVVLDWHLLLVTGTA